ncbi:MAG TPA: rRNA maturation RNase YbeY [Candidatus Sericytochromatia bacterium]
MQVEVSVQDCFFTASQSAATEADESSCPISMATWESWFYQWLENLKPDISPANAYELSLRLTNNTEIQSLNAQYRNKNQPTDVLAFAALEVDSPQLPPQIQLSLPLYLGDIVISVDTAHRQAQQQGHSLKTELAWLATHGLLHLLGWDHPDEESLMAMLEQQSTLLALVNLTIQV